MLYICITGLWLIHSLNPCKRNAAPLTTVHRCSSGWFGGYPRQAQPPIPLPQQSSSTNLRQLVSVVQAAKGRLELLHLFIPHLVSISTSKSQSTAIGNDTKRKKTILKESPWQAGGRAGGRKIRKEQPTKDKMIKC